MGFCERLSTVSWPPEDWAPLFQSEEAGGSRGELWALTYGVMTPEDWAPLFQSEEAGGDNGETVGSEAAQAQ